MLADQGRLVAPRQTVDDAGGPRLAGQQRPGHDIGFHIDHDDVLAVLDGLEGILDAVARVARRLDQHLDSGELCQSIGAVGDEGTATGSRVVQRGRRVLLGGPAGRRALRAGPWDAEVGDADEMHSLRHTHLGKEHGPELAGADQPDGDRSPSRLSLQQHAMKVHGYALSSIVPPLWAALGWRR